MEILIPIIAIGGFWAVLIIWVSLHYASKARRNGTGPLINPGTRSGFDHSQADGNLLDDLRRMEERVRTLERILDADHPGWRSKL